MPEEKKESFTFSDKIKSSKPAGSKSYAKSSSKIGRDGKPKQTLFERTRRDAPFFIAALVALLLLPFLYKYSGQSTSEETLLTPGSEESMFDPERYGFDTAMIEDPEGQVAQLSGRSSFDLIRGMGNDEEDYGARDDFDFDASSTARGEYSAEGEYEAKRNASTRIDEEENITNIYKRRARAATRAAFRRTPTAIGSLNPAALRRGSGSKLGINPWGGSIKEAANKVKASKPKDAPKPVSLQPLRAGGPARSSFGQGAAAAARKGLDNMGKANAAEALRDSYVKPVDPTRVGGLDLTTDGRFGGGGKLDRNINIAPGREPWWWDMMKTRMQKEWEARFNYKWGWINWATDIAKNILKGLINCLITGNSDGDPDNFLGDVSVNGSSGKEPKCCGVKASGWAKELEEIGASSLTESSCKTILKKKHGEADYKKKCGDNFWEKGSSASGASVGFFGQRWKCLGINVGSRWSGDIGLHAKNGGANICEEMPFISVVGSGPAKQIYYVVTARNYFPANLKLYFGDELPQGDLLCSRFKVKHGKYAFNHGAVSGGASSSNSVNNQVDRTQVGIQTNKPHANPIYADTYSDHVNPESKGDSCVIFVQHASEEGAGTFDYNEFETTVRDSFQALLNKKGIKGDRAFELAREAFQSLDLLSVQAVAMKDPLAAGTRTSKHKLFEGMLPMLHWEFESAYLVHKGVTNRPNDRTSDISKADVRNPNEVYYGSDTECDFGDMVFDCGTDDAATAYLRFNARTYRGGQWITDESKKPSADDVKVSATFTYLNAGEEKANTPVTQTMISPKAMDDGFTFAYTMQRIYDNNQVKTTKDAVYDERGGEGKTNLVGNITWTAQRGSQVITRTCPLNLSGDGYTKHVREKKCDNAQQSEDCCKEIMEAQGLVVGRDFYWEPNAPVGSQCKRIEPEPECKTGNESLECCHRVKGSDYMWDPQHNPPCYKEGPQPRLQTRLAPVLSWVPGTGTTDCRQQAGDENNPSEDVFRDCSKVPGISRKEEEHCASQIPLMMDSQAAADFVKDVVAKYNASIANKPTEKRLSDKFYSNLYPTDGEFVDALFLARKVGISEVPSSAVCELARDMVRMSKDPHAGHMQAAQGDDFKGLARPFRNDLGAFLVYVHPTSILYPNAYYGAQSRECDWRFRPEGSSCNGRPSHLKMGKAFYYNYYNDSAHGSNLQAYLASFSTVGIKETYPLAQLVVGHTDLAHNCPNDNCASNRNKYNKDDHFGLMISDLDSVDGRGQACVAFAGEAKMSVDKAIEYVQNVCKTGLDAKPYGNQYSGNPGQAQYKAGQTFKGRTNTRPGNDGGVQKPRG